MNRQVIGRWLLRGCFLLSLLGLSACTGLPEKITPVSPFEVSRYLGTWHEVARYDHRFERGLSQVTAHYSLRDDGGIRVLNRGYSREEGRWRSAEGRAYFVGEPNLGHLKVSFFGPFYGSYAIFYLDPSYQYAWVTGPNRDYLWLLSRTPSITPERKAELLGYAQAAGFAVEPLIWVEQGAVP
jgi:apolipoprotein D and lipocalin family protein